MKKLVSISLSPNLENDDLKLSLSIIINPLKWFDIRKTYELENEFSKYFGNGYHAAAVNSGRSALYITLKALGIGPGDSVCIQALTCTVVVNAILALGAKPIYIDVENNFNMNVLDLRNKIMKSTKAVIVQNTFGIPCDINKISLCAKDHKIFLIEDCATSLGARYHKSKVGSVGDVSFFSFGRDKVISGVFGGMIVTKNNIIFKKINNLIDELEFPSFIWLLRQLFHPIVTSIVIKTYGYGFGKASFGKLIHWLCNKLGIISKAVYKEEKFGIQSKYFPKKAAGGLSALALNQFKKLNKFNSHRKKMSEIYLGAKIPGLTKVNSVKGTIWHRFPILSHKRDLIIKYFSEKGIVLGDWYKDVVTPVVNLGYVFYEKGSCKNAEEFSKKLLNLPTSVNITTEIAEDICKNLILCQKKFK